MGDGLEPEHVRTYMYGLDAGIRGTVELRGMYAMSTRVGAVVA